jgi:hypothetical protein
LLLLSCVCHHPLLLSEVTPTGFRSLPMQLSPTLLLNQQGLSPNMQRLFRASSYRGLHLTGNRGTVIDLYGPKAIFYGNEAAVDILGDGMIHISVAPSLQSTTLDEQVQNEIANHFQSRLLMYRLKNSGTVCESRVEVSEFTFAMRQLARSVAMCFPEDAELARDAVQLLRQQDEDARGQRSRDVNCAIVEILLGIIHQRKQAEKVDRKDRAVKVDELAKDLNALLQSRGELIEYSAVEIGWKLKGLNIKRHTDRCGRQVLLDRGTSQIVHQLARAYDLPRPQCLQGDCPDFAPSASHSS